MTFHLKYVQIFSVRSRLLKDNFREIAARSVCPYVLIV